MCKWGTDTIVQLKDWRRKGELRDIAIDSCIADKIKHLNDIGIKTINSCCGHLKGNGSLLIHKASKTQIEKLGYTPRAYTKEHSAVGILWVDLPTK